MSRKGRLVLLAGACWIALGIHGPNALAGDGAWQLAKTTRPGRGSQSGRDATERSWREMQRRLNQALEKIETVRAPEANPGLTWGGYLQVEERWETQAPYDYTWNEYRLSLESEIRPSEQLHFFSELWIRGLELPGNIGAAAAVPAPNWLDLREAYVDAYDLGIPHLDLRVGKQRIAWGRGDRINPTDNINPYDLTDPADLGRHLGSMGAKLSYYWDDFRLTGVYLPTFTPAALPGGAYAAAFMTVPVEIPNTVTVHSIDAHINLPGANPEKNNTFAVKLEKNILGFDCSLSYVNGREDLPVVNTITASIHSIVWPSTVSVNVRTDLIYPRRQIVGFDAAGTFGDWGVWGEMACILPETVPLTTTVNMYFYNEITRGESQSNQPYLKYLVGTDYRITDDLYLNLQFLHGFLHEKGAENLEDYLLCNVEWKLGDRLKLVPIQGLVECRNIDELYQPDFWSEYFGFFWSPALIVTPWDNLEFQAGAHIYDGSMNTVFGSLNAQDEYFVKMKFVF